MAIHTVQDSIRALKAEAMSKLSAMPDRSLVDNGVDSVVRDLASPLESLVGFAVDEDDGKQIAGTRTGDNVVISVPVSNPAVVRLISRDKPWPTPYGGSRAYSRVEAYPANCVLKYTANENHESAQEAKEWLVSYVRKFDSNLSEHVPVAITEIKFAVESAVNSAASREAARRERDDQADFPID